MATKRTVELKGLSVEQLQNEVTEFEGQLKSLRFDHATRGIQNPLQLREAKRELARIKTELRSRELEAGGEDLAAKRSRIRLRRRLKK